MGCSACQKRQEQLRASMAAAAAAKNNPQPQVVPKSVVLPTNIVAPVINPPTPTVVHPK